MEASEPDIAHFNPAVDAGRSFVGRLGSFPWELVALAIATVGLLARLESIVELLPVRSAQQLQAVGFVLWYSHAVPLLVLAALVWRRTSSRWAELALGAWALTALLIAAGEVNSLLDGARGVG